MTILTLYAVAVSFCAAITFLLLAPSVKKARAYSRCMQQCGYLPDPPTERGHCWLIRLAKFITFVQVGKVEVSGRENLDDCDGPYIVTPNHPHYADVAVMPLVLMRKARYMAARGVMTAFGGFGGAIAGPLGAFAADLTPGKGGPARESAVELLCRWREPLVMFPEGWAYLDGQLGPFKKGAVRIARETSRRFGKTSYLIPVYLLYGRYPGNWITRIHPKLEYFLMFLLFWRYRRGVKVVIGRPIPSTELPADDAEATEMLKSRILALKPATK